MKIQLDTTTMIIKIEGTVNLGDLFNALIQLLPNGKWKEFSLEQNATIEWVINPIIYPIYSIPPPIWPVYPLPYTPPYQPWITYTSESSNEIQNYSINNGTFYIETNMTKKANE